MIIGTAGHIDHGKTSLVKALTGIDADRLKEEKARGITIDMGFAYTPLPNGEILGFVVRNTLVICLTVGHNSPKGELIPRWSCGDICHSHVKRKTRCERNLWPISLLAG